ncbi:predicted protein [Chaetoceros tenuissimus]|uniref:RxLR effector protein n=1 Tax=Chaetoceros tenuissimus TaxID=426638 RepID=A0AAD3H5W1_9STRA|nr:predicted protein [Chaetoceros tenuissimus]
MKVVLLRQTLMICLALFASAAQDVSKPKTSLRSIERTENNHRDLSMWASFLSFVRCPPGPLGNGCRDDDSGSSGTGDSSGGDSDNDKDSGSSTDSGRWYSNRSSGGDNDASDNNDASGNDGEVSSQQNAYYSNGRGGAGGGTAAASYLRNSTSWIAIIGGLALLATGIAVIMHKTSQNEKVADGHVLTGSVQKRNKAFSKAMTKKLGWKKTGNADLEETLA